MISTEKLTPRLSPLDWYKLGSSVLFVILGLFLLVRGLVMRTSYTQPLLGGLLVLYGAYRLSMALRVLRRLRREARESLSVEPAPGEDEPKCPGGLPSCSG